MPLLDHFHAPLAPRRHWESFHVNWAGAMADVLNQQLLPEGFFAEEHAHVGARVEIDVATFTDNGSGPVRDGNAATMPPRVWVPPAPPLLLPAAFPDDFEVLIYQSEGGATLVAAIELISPANKDREAHRRALAVKCASYLVQGISLILIDIVTSRQANLHNEIMQLLKHPASSHLPAEATLYAVAYRPVVRGKLEQIDVWPATLALGQPLPTMPLGLNAELCLPLDLEATYTVACQRRRLL
jgi:hypothetical protein